MAQLSRPYQIALAAIVVLGLVWAVALRSHGSNPSEPAPARPTASTAANASTPSTTGVTAGTKGTGAATPIYHGSAPGVEGLTRAIAKAHGAVAASQQNVNRIERKASELSGESSRPSGVPSRQAVKRSSVTQKQLVASTVANRTKAKVNGTLVRSHAGRSVQQVQVEAELAHGKTVMLVFWNPKSSVDREVLAQADALAGASKGTVTLHAALSNQVGLFGTITEVVHVYQTPTILIVNRHGVVSTLTGLTDEFSLQQAVREARAAKG